LKEAFEEVITAMARLDAVLTAEYDERRCDFCATWQKEKVKLEGFDRIERRSQL